MIPEELAQFATRFEFTADGMTYTIERYNNHGRLLPDGSWCVAVWFTRGDVPNVHYLGFDGKWRYKNGVLFGSLERAWEAYRSADPPS